LTLRKIGPHSGPYQEKDLQGIRYDLRKGDSLMIGPFEPLLAAAVRAPSGDNTQPWRFAVDAEAGTIAVHVDAARDPSPMNANQRMARIAAGAALENLLRAARGRGWDAELEPAPAPALAKVRLAGRGDREGPEEDAIAGRVTNRRAYDGRPVPPGLLDRLAGETPEEDGVATLWVVGADRLGAFAPLIGRADALMFGEPSMRRAFLAKVRFDAAPDEPVADGLSLSSLELTGADRLALRLMARTPDWVLKLGGAPRVFASKARQLVESASGLCLVVAADGSEATDLAVGRAMQRAWLALTAQGLAAQPMMSLPVLENALEHGDAALRKALEGGRAPALRDELRSLAPEIGGRRPAFLLRFGFAEAPSGRTGRMPPSAVTDVAVPGGPSSSPTGPIEG
jgi:nitroreductase